jgi:hypothetical protein
MTSASAVEETGVVFDYGAEAELFPTRNRNRNDNRSATDVLRKLRRPSASRSRSFHPNFFSAPWSVAIHPAGVEMPGKVISGRRDAAEKMARCLIDKWLERHPRKALRVYLPG